MEVEKVFFSGKEIVLVGTAHISKKSAELVRKVIEKEKPEIVGIELDNARYQQLLDERKWRETNIFSVIKEGKAFLFLANILLSNFQKRLGQEVGAKAGVEMLEAINIAREKSIPIVLLDREVSVTMKRAISLTGMLEKIKLSYSLFLALFFKPEKIDEQKIEELKKKDSLNALMQELATELPSTKRVLVDERDLFIANKILEQKAKKIVAVVGFGHLEGVKRFLDRKRDVSELNTIPKKTSILALARFAVPLVFLLLLFFVFSSKGTAASINVIIAWIAITGFLSAFGVLIARGHVFSAATAFLVAPLTTLHPFLASGWFAGMVEARIRMPKVKDFEELQEIKNFSDFSRNAVTRVLLVVALANLGASIGTVIAFTYIAGAIA